VRPYIYNNNIKHTFPIVFFVALGLVSCGGSGNTSQSTGGICGPGAFTPNYSTASGLTLRRWAQLPITVFFTTNSVIPNSGGITYEDLYRQGFQQWEDALGVNLWMEVNDSASAQLKVTTKFTAPQNTLAITTVNFFRGETTLQGAVMTVNSWPAIANSDYTPTAAHELGHALGIGGHSDSVADIMFFTGNRSGFLTTPDLNTLRTAYCNFSLTKPLQNAGKVLVYETISCN
jgi:hypothetical protein